MNYWLMKSEPNVWPNKYKTTNRDRFIHKKAPYEI